MQTPVSLRSIERQAFRATLADGLWDVFIGCFVLMFALAPVLSQSLGDFWSSFIFLPFWGVVYLGIWLIRKYVVTPRMGQVSLGQLRIKRLRKLNLVMLAITVALFLFGVLMFIWAEGPGGQNLVPWFGSLFGLVSGFLLLTGFSVAAFVLDYVRLYVYGLLLFAALPIGEWLYANQISAHHGFPVVFGVVAAIMIVTGLLQFLLLLKNNPAIAVEEA